MTGRLKHFLQDNFAVPADELQDALHGLHLELLALPPVTMDFTSPEGAILCLEEAYRRKDIEAAVRAHDFIAESGMILRKTGFEIISEDDEVLANLAGALEMLFRSQTLAAWPDFSHGECFFPKREVIDDGIVAITEVCRFSDGFFSKQRILVAETANGWRVVNPE
jgi:hypothetical protein